MIDLGVDDVARTGIIAEGYGVDHAHIKLFPMHQTPKSWAQIKSNNNKVFSKYEGYISSHDGPRASDLELQLMAKNQGDLKSGANQAKEYLDFLHEFPLGSCRLWSV